MEIKNALRKKNIMRIDVVLKVRNTEVGLK